MTKNNPQIIVLSRNYSTGLGVIRALGMAGYAVDLIASVKQKGSSVICRSSKYVARSTEVLAPNIRTDKGEVIIEELMKYEKGEEKPIIFPCDDYTTSIIDNNRKALEERFIMPKAEDHTIMELMDKRFQAAEASKAGIHVPKEWQVDLRQEVEIPEVTFPVFVKPENSVIGHKSEMGVIDNRDDLAKHLKSMQSTYAERIIVLQEFLNIEKEYDFSGLCLGNRIIIPGVLEKTHIAKHERGVTMAGKMIAKGSTPELHEVMPKVEKLLQSFNYFGMFDMELNLVDGKIYFGEVNLRSGGPNFSYCLSGVNLPDIFVKEALGRGHSPEEEELQEYGKVYVYEKVAWEDYINGFMSKKEMEEVIKSADYTLLASDEDPEPGKIFSKRIRLSALKHKILK